MSCHLRFHFKASLMKAQVAQAVVAFSLFAGAICGAALPPVENKIVPRDGARQDYFGDSVALDGDTLVVGASLKDVAYQDAGAVYIYVKNASGGWVEQQKLINTDPSDGFLFGSAVALSGDTLVVGSPYNYLGDVGGGAAYVYTRNACEWTEQSRLSSV